jgi:hypothetical protein
VGERGGNEPLYPEPAYKRFNGNSRVYAYFKNYLRITGLISKLLIQDLKRLSEIVSLNRALM